MPPSHLIVVCLALGGCGGGSSSNGSPSNQVPPVPPEVSQMTPSDAPWGTALTIAGKGLGSSARSGVELAIGEQGELVLSPGDNDEAIVTWTETEIQIRVPFPHSGPISIETPQGADLAGEFTPSWITGPSVDAGPAAVVLSALSPAEGKIAILLDAGTPRLIEIDDQAVVERTLDAANADLSTAQLFVSESGEVEAIALSKATTPELLHLARTGEDLAAVATGIQGPWENARLAGGSAGGFAWLEQGGQWSRVSAVAGVWSVDKGPVADPAPSGELRAVAATSDGALHVTWNVATGDLFDDMEAPTLSSFAPEATGFSAGLLAGGSVDDYLTVLELEARGHGLRLHYCGSDVDPVLGTPAEESCRNALRTSGGESQSSFLKEDENNRYVFTPTLIGAARCTADGLALGTGAEDPGEVAIWDCPRLLAVEVDQAGYFLPIIQADSRIWSPRRRKAAAE